jgi:ribonuclease D
VNNQAALLEVVAQLVRAERIALDTEGNGMHAYVPRLSVLQLCVAEADRPAEQVFVLDPLAPLDLAPLAPLVSAGGPAKIIHDLGFDARLLRGAGMILGRVLDTSVHARFLGLRETGLAALLGSRHGVVLCKALQRHDWARRPLSSEQLSYLADDVAYLGPLAYGLELAASQAGISEEVAVEAEYALGCAHAPEPDLPPYARIRGVHKLAPSARAVLRELSAVRETAAARWDLPPGRIVSNDGLVRLAKVRPKTAGELARLAGLHGRSRSIAGELFAALERGGAAGDVPEAERGWFVQGAPPAPHGAHKARERALIAWRKAECAARGVDPQVVLPGHALAALAGRGVHTMSELSEVPGLGQVRVRRYGTTLLGLLAAAQHPALTPT